MGKRDEARTIQEALQNVVQTTADVPRLEAFRLELGTDQAGDPAAFVTAILEERTPDEMWTSDHLDPIESRIRAAVEASGSDRWVYVRFARPSDLRAAG